MYQFAKQPIINLTHLNMKKFKLFTALCFFILLCTSCTSDFLGLDSKGTITGFVVLYDADGVKQADFTGVTVSIDGQNISATTDSKGKFQLTGVKKGIYTISMSKTDYATRKVVSYQFIGTGDAFYGSTSLSKIPQYSVTGLTATTYSGSSVSFSFSSFIGTLGTYKYVRYYISDAIQVSSDPQKYLYISGLYTISSVPTTLTASKSNLNAVGLTSGQTAYAIFYADVSNSVYYTDINTGKVFYTSLGTPSSVVSFIVP